MANHIFRRFALVLGAVALSASGIAATQYEIALRNGSTVLSRSQPARYGTVLVYRGPDGRLTGLPVEEVTAVQALGVTKGAKATRIRTTTTTTRVTAAPATGALEPGGTLLLGPTGGEGGATTAEPTVVAAPAPGMASGGTPVYGGGAAVPGAAGTQPGTAVSQQTNFPNAAPVTGIGPDGLPRGLGSGPPPTAATSGLNPPGTTMSPAGATPPGSNIEPTGTSNPRASGTASPAGSTPPGSSIEPSGTSNPRGSGTTAPAGSVPSGAAAPPPAAPPPPSSPPGR